MIIYPKSLEGLQAKLHASAAELPDAGPPTQFNYSRPSKWYFADPGPSGIGWFVNPIPGVLRVIESRHLVDAAVVAIPSIEKPHSLMVSGQAMRQLERMKAAGELPEHLALEPLEVQP